MPATRKPWLIRVICIERRTLGLLVLTMVIIAALAFAGYTVVHASTPVRIGVLLPLTGDIEFQETLEWARDNINREGGIGGRQIELVFKDTNAGDTGSLAGELLADDSIQIVIGPSTSDEVFDLAPAFLKKNKLLISPTATSGDIFRAFGKKGYFWRTPQGDVAQVKVILSVLNDKGTHRIALVAENSTYGRTFYEWTGFFATEYGMELASIQQVEPGSGDIESSVADALSTDPEYLIAVCTPADAAAIKRSIDQSGSRTKLFLADAAATPVLISTLGSAAEGLEGTSPTADPASGFAAAYQRTFGHAPEDYAALTYDALLLAAYTSARQDAVFFESPADSFRYVIYGNGTAYGWDAHGAITDLRQGRSVSVSGASGPLDYDTDAGVDPLVTYYSHWVVKDGNFRVVRTLDPALAGVPGVSGESIGRSKASSSLASPASSAREPDTNMVGRSGFVAVIVGPSGGWKNYRHQADALGMYTLLREKGVTDDQIILMTYDDIPTTPENPLRGDVHNVPKGTNLRPGARPDYTGDAVSSATLRAVLLGNRSETVPVVVESNRSTDLFVYIVSHGMPGAIAFRQKETFTTQELADITSEMYREGRYRQMAVMVDTCFGESIGTDITAPGILYITGAAASEPSKGAVYDMDISQWLSDEFSATVIAQVRSDPGITFRELYLEAYKRVTGSHVRMKTTGNFSISQPVGEYLRP